MRALLAAIAAGPGALQLRDKDLDAAHRLRRARRLIGPCRDRGVKLLVNARVDVAVAAGCDGVHLPGDGLPPVEARRLLPAGGLVGRSVHGEDELDVAVEADFLFFGPVFDTPSKRAFGEPQGVARLARLCARAGRPVLAVGGIDASRVPEVIRAGAAGVAVIGAVLDAPDPGAVVGDLAAALAAAR
ncbi:MAG: thiamine phosphate synthase [Alphaproteobacteria bacterium]